MSKIGQINYDIQFEPIFTNFTFNGIEIITLTTTSTNTFTLNSAELEIKNCHIIHKGKTIKAKSSLNVKNETLSIKTAKKISGRVKICIEFTGILNDRLLGFYRSKYKDTAGKTKHLATTQFEAADARRAFPCWDEPAVKATFDVSLLVDRHMTAISNMPEKVKKKVNSKVLVEFERTPIMSTYLLYLGVGEFEFIQDNLRNIKLRVVTTKGNKKKARLSLDLTKKFLSEYEKYFGIKYPLPKLDMLAIPDFAAGAMENWGAITFRETILLYDPKTSSTRTKQYIAEVISHELAHQWFGNLVTMKWWNDLWLNESFATFMATKIVDKFYPEWDLWDQFLDDAMNTAMSLDSLKTSHPIDVDVNHPSEIRSIFDSISYDKGGCILRMLENFVGDKNFQNGLKKYLTKHQYSNAQGSDLWNAIGTISKQPVDKMMKTWINQVGFPLVSVTRKNSNLSLTQSRFLLEETKSSKKGVWSIPLIIEEGDNRTKKLMRKKSERTKLKNKERNFIINPGRTGFYRVQYDHTTLENLSLLIDEKIIDYVDRWSLQNDYFAQVISGKKHVKDYLNFTNSYYDEDNYISSLSLAHNLYSLYITSHKEKFSDELRQYAINFLGTIIDRLGWDTKKNESHTNALLRSFAIVGLGKLGDKQVISEAELRFKKFLKNPNTLPADLQESVFSLVAWNGDESVHKKFLRLYKKANSQEEKLRFLAAMCSFKQKKLLLKTLEFTLGPDVRSQNIQMPIMRTTSNIYGHSFMWPWLKKNWKRIVGKAGIGNPLLNRVVASIGQVIVSTQEKEVRKFFKENPVRGTERTLEQTLERVRIHSKLLSSLKKEFS
jgi:tricorn protease interacting factor F2/3|tara:strand:+ start:1432 stop:3930 length:2499 start_codon:yes stop_codon:yes gene_type:complete